MTAKVYFEKQGADRLCGVHCLNSLLQGPIFTQVDLNRYASELDQEEAKLLSSKSSAPAPRSMTISSLSSRPESENVNHTDGYFSLGVLEKALKSKFSLVVENAARRDIVQNISRNGFSHHEGFVIHLRDHWFSARRVADQWYFLDSLKSVPQPVSENDLWGTLQGLIQSGNNVFVISGGKLPDPVGLPGKPRLVLKAHQYLLSPSEISDRLHQSVDSTNPDGSSSFSNKIPQKSQQTDWASLGSGQSLASNLHTARLDPDVQKAVQDSLKDSLKPETTEPNASAVWHVSLRLSSGARVNRKFSLSDDTVQDVVAWVRFASGAVSSDFSLVGRGFKILVGTSSARINEKEVGWDSKLGDCGIAAGQDLLNLAV